jgi:hypothetical protein
VQPTTGYSESASRGDSFTNVSTIVGRNVVLEVEKACSDSIRFASVSVEAILIQQAVSLNTLHIDSQFGSSTRDRYFRRQIPPRSFGSLLVDG